MSTKLNYDVASPSHEEATGPDQSAETGASADAWVLGRRPWVSLERGSSGGECAAAMVAAPATTEAA